MTPATRFLSAVLLASGVFLVFAGLTSAVGVTLTGAVVSAAAVAALLYTGAVWFGAPRPASTPASLVLLFDRSGRVAAGPGAGEPLTAHFDGDQAAGIQRHAAAALSGASVHFVCDHGGARTAFMMIPVRAADGSIPCAILTTASALSAAIDADAVSAVV